MILVTGGNGGLANNLRSHILLNNFLFLDIDELDITSYSAVQKIFNNYNIEFIFHFAAYTNVDNAEIEKEKCFNVNVIGTQNLTEFSIKFNIPILYISTDYIFDGTKPITECYTEEDKPNPINYYGWTKLKGEEEILKNKKHFIIRTEWLYGQNSQKKNFVSNLVNKIKNNEEIKIVSDQYGTLTSYNTVNLVILELIKNNKFGIYNVVNYGYSSRLDIALFIANFFNFKKSIKEIKTVNTNDTAKRPLNSKLALNKLLKTINIKIPDWQNELINYLQFFK